MTTRTSARHRKATRPLTPLTSVSPMARRSMAVAASSGLAATMIATGAHAAGVHDASASAGSLESGMGAIAAPARDAVVTNAAIAAGEVAAAADLETVSAVSVEAAVEETPAQTPADHAGATAEQAGVADAAAPAYASAPANASGSSILGLALQYTGVPYVYGGSTPAGWDCAGFVQYVYGQAGIALPRTSQAQGSAGTLVSAAEAQPGDIVYYGYHVGIYAGDGMMIDAGTPETGTVYRPVWGSPIGYIRVG